MPLLYPTTGGRGWDTPNVRQPGYPAGATTLNAPPASTPSSTPSVPTALQGIKDIRWDPTGNTWTNIPAAPATPAETVPAEQRAGGAFNPEYESPMSPTLNVQGQQIGTTPLARTQYATPATANALAALIGGGATSAIADVRNPFGTTTPQYNINLGGREFNAGLISQEIARDRSMGLPEGHPMGWRARLQAEQNYQTPAWTPAQQYVQRSTPAAARTTTTGAAPNAARQSYAATQAARRQQALARQRAAMLLQSPLGYYGTSPYAGMYQNPYSSYGYGAYQNPYQYGATGYGQGSNYNPLLMMLLSGGY